MSVSSIKFRDSGRNPDYKDYGMDWSVEGCKDSGVDWNAEDYKDSGTVWNLL